MIAATQSQKHVTGVQLEDLNKNPSKFQKELKRIVQKNKNKKVTILNCAAFTNCGKRSN